MAIHRWFWPVVGCVIAIAGALEVSSALGEAQTWDEGIHISAGYAYLARGDYRWNAEHPPLAKLVSALPLKLLRLDVPVNGEGWKKNDEIKFGIEFLYANRVPADSILMAARGMAILLTLVFAAALAWWTRRRFGPAAGLLAVVLCAFDPNLMANGRYVTTDFPVTVFYFFACVLWVEYLESGRFRDLAVAACAFALAMVTKFSAVLLIPTLAVLYGVCWAQRPKQFPLRRLVVAAGVVLGATLVVVSVVYWPDTLRCLNTHVAPLAGVVDRRNLTGKILYYAGRWFHLPRHAFLFGLNAVATHNAGGHAGYLMGLRSDQGWWYYFPVVFAVKSTMAALAGTALLLLAGFWLAATRLSRRVIEQARAIPPMWIGLLFPPALYFVFSMTSGINIGMRHILPVYPFLYVAVAALLTQLRSLTVAARYQPATEPRPSEAVKEFSYAGGTACATTTSPACSEVRQAVPPASPACGRFFHGFSGSGGAPLSIRRLAGYTMIALGALQMAECASITPDYLAFFNALSGGPGKGPEYLVDSNIDWGQDVKKLVKWLDAHGTRKAWCYYFGNAQLRYYGVDEVGMPGARDRKGWDAIDGFAVANVTPLQGLYVPLEDLAPLRLREPIAKIGWSMYVYDLRKPGKR